MHTLCAFEMTFVVGYHKNLTHPSFRANRTCSSEKSFFDMLNKPLVKSPILSYPFLISKAGGSKMKLVLTLALAVGLALGSYAIMSSDALACGGKDKGATTEDTTGTSDSTES